MAAKPFQSMYLQTCLQVLQLEPTTVCAVSTALLYQRVFFTSFLDAVYYPISSLGREGGYLISGLGRVGTPSQVWVGGYPILGPGRGVPHLGGVPHVQRVPHVQKGGYPHVWGVPMSGGYPISPLPPPITQSNIASTCYAAGGVSLAFTQEHIFIVC